MLRPVVLLLFFFSGAAALVYEIAWTRSLGLVFGASHLAVTTVLAVYMGGQALGSALLAKRADATARPLRLYGLLELGIAVFAVLFLGLMKVYPVLYGPLARLADESPLYLTVLRVGFAVVATIVPTTLMGATLPVLTRFVAGREGGPGKQLSFLYAFNTFGAVAGSLLAGFVLLEALGVTATLLSAAGVSAAIGVAALVLQRRLVPGDVAAVPRQAPQVARPGGEVSALTVRLTLWGIGVSGFCALGYEVLWTRMLTLVVGTSVYSFTLMLVAFLTGIGLGSQVFGLAKQLTARRAALVFAGSQFAIGATALAVTIAMRDLPDLSTSLQGLFVGLQLREFSLRLLSSSVIAVAFMLVPAFFMGAAFPAAGTVWAQGHQSLGAAVGRLLSSNTLGAILGASVSGFALVSVFGIERSLQLLVALNVAAGLVVAVHALGRPRLMAPVLVALAAVLGARAAWPGWGRSWNEKYFAAHVNSLRRVETPEQRAERLQSLDLLYYREGVNETVSVTQPAGDIQTFIVNGRPEASNHPVDVQCQRALGHLPMLLHPGPRRVFVLGTGTGMTLGSTALHPEVEKVVLAEIEEGVLGVARTFADWNHHVLDNPKLHIVFNDGRNYLATTREEFDVITADPIHPWSGGAAYLYTQEYFRSVAERLAPRGIACQWLPLYELTTRDLQTVVKTFASEFKYVMIWRTYFDAELIGSNDPLVIDEAALARRLAFAPIRDALAEVQMGSPRALLSSFVAGTPGAHAFATGGALNTDDNLVLEFSAPRSQGEGRRTGENLLALSGVRESVAPYLVPAPTEEGRALQRETWAQELAIGRQFDPLHARYVGGEAGTPEFEGALSSLARRWPDYAPLRFLLDDKAFMDRTSPALVAAAEFPVRAASGAPSVLRISGVRQYMGRGRVLVSFVDNERREILGQRYLFGEYARLDGEVGRYVDQTLLAMRTTAEEVSAGTGGLPGESRLSEALRRQAAQLVGTLPATTSP